MENSLRDRGMDSLLYLGIFFFGLKNSVNSLGLAVNCLGLIEATPTASVVSVFSSASLTMTLALSPRLSTNDTRTPRFSFGLVRQTITASEYGLVENGLFENGLFENGLFENGLPQK